MLHMRKNITQYQSVFDTQKNISQNSTIPERAPHAEKYNTKLHNTHNYLIISFLSCFLFCFIVISRSKELGFEYIDILVRVAVLWGKCLTLEQIRPKKNSTKLELVPRAEIYNTQFIKTGARYTVMQKYITHNYTVPECIPHEEKYNTKFHNTTERSTCRKL